MFMYSPTMGIGRSKVGQLHPYVARGRGIETLTIFFSNLHEKCAGALVFKSVLIFLNPHSRATWLAHPVLVHSYVTAGLHSYDLT